MNGNDTPSKTKKCDKISGVLHYHEKLDQPITESSALE